MTWGPEPVRFTQFEPAFGTQNTSITASKEGTYIITYKLSGPAATSYQIQEDAIKTTVHVTDPPTPAPTPAPPATLKVIRSFRMVSDHSGYTDCLSSGILESTGSSLLLLLLLQAIIRHRQSGCWVRMIDGVGSYPYTGSPRSTQTHCRSYTPAVLCRAR